MTRSYVAAGALGLALCGLWYTGGGARPAAAATPRVAAPVAHANLAVYLIHGPDAVDDARVVTLPEALARGWAVVHETGSVNQLAVENTSPGYDLFVQSGDIVKGGRQDRLIATDLLVPPGAGRVAVPSHCVEQSRWAGRGQEPAAYFAASDKVAVGNAIKLANANRNQGEVWAEVKAGQDKLSRNLGTAVNAAASPTSLQLALESPAVRAKVAEYRAALGAAGADRPGVVGAVFVVNGKVTSADVYGSNGLFRRAWPRLLEAAATEALAEAVADRPTPTPPAAREIERFLAQAEQPEAAAEGDRAGRSVAAVNPAGAVNRNDIQQAQTLRRQQIEAFTSYVALEDLDEVVQTEGGAVQTEGGVGGPVLVDGVAQTGAVAGFVGRSGATRSRLLRQQPADARSIVVHDPDATANLAPARREWAAAPQPGPPANPAGNRLTTTRVESAAALVLEAKDPARNAVIHKSYIKK